MQDHLEVEVVTDMTSLTYLSSSVLAIVRSVMNRSREDCAAGTVRKMRNSIFQVFKSVRKRASGFEVKSIPSVTRFLRD